MSDGACVRVCGWQPDAPDPRDHAFSLSSIASDSKEPPSKASLRRFVRGMFDQLDLGSCVGNAFSRADHMLKMMDYANGEIPEVPEPSSRLFHYYNSRFQHGSEARDSGTFIRLCIRQANDLGVPPESVWTYTPWHVIGKKLKWAVKPSMKSYQYASAHYARTYKRIAKDGEARVTEIKKCLSAGMPIIFGTYIAKSFLDDKGDALIKPPGIDPIAGGHAMVMVGYNEDGVEICNSWGSDWRDQGFARLSWEYVTWPGTRDVWCLS